jgi:hypothetical protein
VVEHLWRRPDSTDSINREALRFAATLLVCLVPCLIIANPLAGRSADSGMLTDRSGVVFALMSWLIAIAVGIILGAVAGVVRRERGLSLSPASPWRTALTGRHGKFCILVEAATIAVVSTRTRAAMRRTLAGFPCLPS